MKANAEIRTLAKETGVCWWEVAKKLGIGDATMVRWLRTELPKIKRQQIVSIIEELKGARQNDEV